MSLFTFSVVAAFSVVPALAASLIRLDQWRGKYQPFFILLWLGFLNDMGSYAFIRAHTISAINGNLFVLAEFILIAWLFFRVNARHSMRLVIVLLSIGCMAWILDNLILHSLYDNNSLFRMIGSFLIVYMVIDRLSYLMLIDENPETRRSELFLVWGLLLYYAYKTFVEAFHVFPAQFGRSFYENLWVILAVTNIISNILYLCAIFWLRQRVAFILR